MEYILLENYFQALSNQSEYIVSSDVNQINKNVVTLNLLIKENKSIQKTRQEYQHKLAEMLGFSDDSATITNIISEVDSDIAEQLSFHKQRLVAIVKDIVGLVESNKYLLRYAINFNHNIIQLYDNALIKDNIYLKDGNMESPVNQKKLLDQKA